MLQHQLLKFKHWFRKLPFRGIGMWLVLATIAIVIVGILMYFGIIEWTYKSPYNGQSVGP